MELAYLHLDHLECDQDVVGGQIPAPDLGEGHGPCGGGSTAPKFGGFHFFKVLTSKEQWFWVSFHLILPTSVCKYLRKENVVLEKFRVGL